MEEFQDAVMATLPVIRDEITTLLDNAPEDVALGTLKRLVAYQSGRGQAVLYLATSGMPWDAEIVLRSFYEATARILLISLAAPDERAQLIDEYWGVLGDIGDRRRALRIPDDDGRGALDPRSGAILDFLKNPNVFNVKATGTKRSRKAVEQRWSFSEIMAGLAKSDRADFRGLKELGGYLHLYGNSSHLLHADRTALDFMYDRATREPEEGKLLAAAQICRIHNDILGLGFATADAIRVMSGAKFKNDELVLTVWRTIELSFPLTDAFHDSQADFYRGIGPSAFDEAGLKERAEKSETEV